MPNWCMSTITFNGSEEPIKRLRDFISEQSDMPNTAEPGHFRTASWLGTFLERLGLNPTEYRCRGEITAWPDDIVGEENSNSFTIQTETAWAPMVIMWDVIAKRFSPEIEVIYTAEEPGMASYSTNDPAMRGHYNVDKFDELDEELEENLQGTIFEGDLDANEYSEEEVRANLLTIYPDRVNDTTGQLIDLFQGEYDGFSVNAYEWCPIEEAG